MSPKKRPRNFRWINKGTMLHYEWSRDEVLSIVRLLTRGRAKECSSIEIAAELSENGTATNAHAVGKIMNMLLSEGLVRRRKIQGFSLWQPTMPNTMPMNKEETEKLSAEE